MGKVLYLVCFVLVLTLGKVTPDGGRNTGETAGKIFIPAMAQKAGGRLRSEFTQGTREDQTETENTDKEYNYDAWSNEGSSEEPDCPEKKFYHIRGKQCVPFRCSHGRNQNTGQCKHDYGYGLMRHGYPIYRGGSGLGVGQSGSYRQAGMIVMVMVGKGRGGSGRGRG